jgi:hypothetical protein
MSQRSGLAPFFCTLLGTKSQVPRERLAAECGETQQRDFGALEDLPVILVRSRQRNLSTALSQLLTGAPTI